MTTTEAEHINAEVKSEMESVQRQFPGLSQATALDIACATVSERNKTQAERQADARRWLNEREEVKVEGKHPLWR